MSLIPFGRPTGLFRDQGQGWRLLLPSTLLNGDFHLPGRHSSFLDIKGAKRLSLGGRRGKYIKDQKVLLDVLIEMGINQKVASHLVTRDKLFIRCLELQIGSIIDNLLLFDWEIFRIDSVSSDLKILKSVIRKLIHVSTYSIDTGSQQWKNFTAVIFQLTSKGEFVQKAELLSNNLFKPLMGLSKLKSILEKQSFNKADLEALSHLLTTRNLAPAHQTTQCVALDRFKDLVGTEFPLDPEHRDRVYDSARRIGRKISGREGYKTPSGGHISLATSGSLQKTVREGGRVKEILDDITPILSHVPMESETISLPGVTLTCEPGRPRWTTWARDEPLVEYGEFGSSRLGTMFGENNLTWGFDEVIGTQIYFCALMIAVYQGYLDDSGQIKQAMLARSVVVPEPGCKARVVTTSHWWVVILQQPVSHLLKETLKGDSSLRDGLFRADQAWLFLRTLTRAKDYPEQSQVLSSDLKEATDAIPPWMAEAILGGYLEGLNLRSISYQIALETLVKPKTIELSYPNGRKAMVHKVRGILMGEPLTKTVLTLLGAVCEEMALRDYLSKSPLDAVHGAEVPWRAFSVGGDDHIAVGPYEYLKGITSNHIRSGSQISGEKHLLSRTYVRYCEKLISVPEIFKGFSYKDINKTDQGYLDCPFVDSVKVRLLSPFPKSLEIRNDRNLAIGKGKSLGRTLRWLNKTQFPPKWVRLVRDRFIQRMGGMLPKVGTSLFAQILLPTSFGGLDLYLDDVEFEWALNHCPMPTRTLILGFAEAKPEQSLVMLESSLRKLSRLTSNCTYRGIKFEDKVYESILDPEHLSGPSILWWEIAEKLSINMDDYSNTAILDMLAKKGYRSPDNILDLGMRGITFKLLLEGKAVQGEFNTLPWKVRYSRLWDEIYMGETRVHLTPAIFKRAAVRTRLRFYDVEEKMGGVDYTTPSGERVVIPGASLRDDLEFGLPTLRIQALLGLPPRSMTDGGCAQ